MDKHPWLGEYHNFLITGNPVQPPQDSPEEIQVRRLICKVVTGLYLENRGWMGGGKMNAENNFGGLDICCVGRDTAH